MPNLIEYDLTNKTADPNPLELSKNDTKDATIKFTNVGFTDVTTTDFDFNVKLTPEKLAQLEGWAIVLNDEDSSKVRYIITSTRFHFDVSLEQYAQLPSSRKGQGSDYVYFITDGGATNDTVNTTQRLLNGEIEEAILLINETRNYINQRRSQS